MCGKTVPCPLLKGIDYVPQHLVAIHGDYSMEVVTLDASEVLDSMQQIQYIILKQFIFFIINVINTFKEKTMLFLCIWEIDMQLD